MIITDESWYIVRNTKGVTGFVGPGSKPVPLSDDEVIAMGIDLESTKVVNGETDLEVGDNVQIKKGPFSGKIGTIEKINMENRTATVSLDAFNKKTPFEMDIESIERI